MIDPTTDDDDPTEESVAPTAATARADEAAERAAYADADRSIWIARAEPQPDEEEPPS